MNACDTFREIDELFIDYENNEDKFNTDYGLYNKYCPVKSGYKRCETNYEKLSAVSGYAYTKLMQNDKVDLDSGYDPSVDFLVMGLSDRLYKLSGDHSLSIKDAFKKYLGNPMGGFNHWNILYNKKEFMGFNIGIMNGFYLLFKQICETISIFEKPNTQQHEYIHSVAQCYIMYNILYNFVNQCDPYLRLLDHLKKIYNEVIEAVIKVNNNDESLGSNLIKISLIDKSEFGFEFNTKGCRKMHKKLEQNISRIKKKPQDEYEEKDEFSTLTELLGSDDENPAGDDSDDDPVSDDDLEDTSQGTPQVLPPGPPQALKLQEPAPPSQPIQSQSDSDPSTADSPPQNGSSSQTPQTGGSSSGNGTPGDGSSDPASSTPGGSFNLGSSLFKFLLNGGEKLNKTSQFIEKNRQTFKDAAKKINDAYNETVNNLKSAYSVSSSYISGFINNITSHLNNIDAPFKPDDDPSGPGKSINGGDPPSQLSSNSPTAPLTTEIDPTDPSTSKKDPPPNPAPSPAPQKQPSSQSHHIIHQTPQVPVQVNQLNSQQIGQLTKSPSSDPILKKTWNIFPTTWNGSGNCKPEIKFMNTTLVCCTYEQCSLTGISVTLILIPTILLIAYKYLSFGSSKKSKKKNMKRVIKLVDGNRKTQIIIKSYDRNKDLKPVINSVDRRKDPLLNIYKLMQADPIPFINLFFLLIFFVYKRKENVLEL
ncbi:PIR protein CIR protein [Plasmodium vinckei vinckei]|uniref:PIR protein CIR protein n=1 Tax=Plasmodium vinckei vinckei TaxID=54757 RepID=A0A449BM95_PLAVN|nr:PIR protein CIR protein [Plasmodium vinckei vinckei]VEV54557.1 PIR protein CIR protein [Plasmodium vinckei vinckei]